VELVSDKTVYLKKHLMIKGRFAKLILTGRKRATIRLGRVIPRSSEIIIHAGGKPIARAVIKNIVYKKVRELTLEDAVKDGYNSLEELLRDLEDVYDTKLSGDEVVTIIEFEVKEEIRGESEDRYMGLQPQKIAKLALKHLSNELSEEDKVILEVLADCGSIRETAYRLFGSVYKRFIVRRALRRALEKLIDKNIIEGKSSTRKRSS